jgi:hypothetical protein
MIYLNNPGFMIHPTPVQTQEVELDHWPPIRKDYLNYESTFVILHPFLKLKEGELDDIDFKNAIRKILLKKPRLFHGLTLYKMRN